jgi:hypothetical protein
MSLTLRGAPQGGVLGHAFIAVDEIVAASERRTQHLWISAAPAGIGCDRATTLRFFSQWPIRTWLTASVETGDFLTKEEKVKAIGPESILAGSQRHHELLQLFEIFCLLLMVAQLGHTLPAVLGLRTTHDHTS